MPLVVVSDARRGVREAVREAMEGARWRESVPAGRPVLVKPNLGWDFALPGSITSPGVTEAVVEVLQDGGMTVKMVEADQVLESVEKAFVRSGMDGVCRRRGVEWVNLSLQRTVEVDIPGAFALPRLAIPAVLKEGTLVTVPVLKTHDKTTITGALKNQWGNLPRSRHRHHLVVNEAIADINRAAPPAFAVMDATICMEGNGPKTGWPRRLDRVLASPDPVALDAVGARIMGFDPAAIRHLERAEAAGLGTRDPAAITVVGDLPATTPFRPAGHNFVSRIELGLRHGPFAPLVFDTPLFAVMLWGAKGWYHAWRFLRERAWTRAAEGN